MLVRTLWINTTTPGIYEEYQTIRMKPRENSFFTRTARLHND